LFIWFIRLHVLDILLASHGTSGAQAAENHAHEVCLSHPPKDRISLFHLYVIPKLWGNMLADDWLNNASTHLQFENYLQSELKKEANENIKRVRNKFDSTKVYTQYEIKYGEPKKCLIDTCSETKFDLVILGTRRPKNIPGLRSSMLCRDLSKCLSTKLLQVPYPSL